MSYYVIYLKINYKIVLNTLLYFENAEIAGRFIREG